MLRLLREAGSGIVRFPGGTIANFYHPHEAGYGYRKTEIDALRESSVKKHMQTVERMAGKLQHQRGIQQNFIHDMAAFARASNSEVLYAANLLNGTVEETLFAIRTLRDAGVRVAGIELGNEYYLKAYSAAFPNAADYTTKASAFAEALRKAFPNIPLSVVAAPPPSVKSLSNREASWNAALAGHLFYDAVSVHYYPRPAASVSSVPPPCTAPQAAQLAGRGFRTAMDEVSTVFGTSTPIWLTEWNVLAAPKWCSQSLPHAVFVNSMLCEMARIPQLEISTYHSALSRGNGFNLLRHRKGEATSANYIHHAFRMQQQLEAALAAGYTVSEQASEASELQLLHYHNANGDPVATIVRNLRDDAVQLAASELPSSPEKHHLLLDDSGLHAAQNNAAEYRIAGNSIHLLIY